MPAKHSLKIYVPQGVYHVYNRGVEKRKIFLDDRDYRLFLFFLKSYLLPKDIIIKEIKTRKDLSNEEQARRIVELSNLKNFYRKIDLFSFVLMPNHYHLLLRQKEENDLEVFMRALNTRYSKYFNKKYGREGHLFQGRYKAILVEKEEYFLHLSRYIHLNPMEILSEGDSLASYRWSSYPAYVREWKIDWLKKEEILFYFKKENNFNFFSYQGFVEGYKEKAEEEVTTYKKLMLDMG